MVGADGTKYEQDLHKLMATVEQANLYVYMLLRNDVWHETPLASYQRRRPTAFLMIRVTQRNHFCGSLPSSIHNGSKSMQQSFSAVHLESQLQPAFRSLSPHLWTHDPIQIASVIILPSQQNQKNKFWAHFTWQTLLVIILTTIAELDASVVALARKRRIVFIKTVSFTFR